MTDKNSTTTVCVTGASGFIAAHLVKQLLEQGYTVKATVRGDANKYPYLTSLLGAAERLSFHQADLLTAGAFNDIVADCDVVMHTASPYVVNVKDSQRELVDPAVNGTLNVLNACAESSRVKRVVLTSSLAAITDEPSNDKVFDESDWNTKSNLKRNPYYFSKAEAEGAAWKFVEQKDKAIGFDLVVINPFLVIGPSLGPSLNESNKIIRDLLKGDYPCLMTINWGLVDVRDVAKAHVLAMQTPEAKGRYLVVNENWTMSQVVDHLRNNGFGNYRLPKLNLATPFGDKLMRILSYTQPSGNATYIRSHVGNKMRFNNSKAINELGISYISAADSINAAAADLLKWKHLKPRETKHMASA